MGRPKKYKTVSYYLVGVRKRAQAEARSNVLPAFFDFVADSASEADVRRGIDEKAVGDLSLLCRPHPLSITARALSVALFGDVERLQHLERIFEPLFRRARGLSIAPPDFSVEAVRYPATLAAGNVRYILAGGKTINASGCAVGLPLCTVEKIIRIESSAAAKRKKLKILTVENKESFYALCLDEGAAQKFDIFVYTGGYPNRAACALLDMLSLKGGRFFHAGDLDPDGILILEQIVFATGCRVTPVKMDAATFDRYRPWSRRLARTALDGIGRISEKTRNIPGIEPLIARIKKTGRGLDQEIIDYR